jgi:hypothetical protein
MVQDNYKTYLFLEVRIEKESELDFGHGKF